MTRLLAEISSMMPSSANRTACRNPQRNMRNSRRQNLAVDVHDGQNQEAEQLEHVAHRVADKGTVEGQSLS